MVKREQSSGTALLIAASLLLLKNDPTYSGLVSKDSANFLARLLGLHSTAAHWMAENSGRPWFRGMARLVERSTIPGILLHYALRKKCIARLARTALAGGATQVVVLGAGFDALCFELRREFPNAFFGRSIIRRRSITKRARSPHTPCMNRIFYQSI